MRQENVTQVLDDPPTQKLMAFAIPARLACTGQDGFPRMIPTGFHWDGAQIIMATHPNTPKVPLVGGWSRTVTSAGT